MTTTDSVQADQCPRPDWFALYATDPDAGGAFVRFAGPESFADHVETCDTARAFVLYAPPIAGLAGILHGSQAPAKDLDRWASDALDVLKVVRRMRKRCLVFELPCDERALDAVRQNIRDLCLGAALPALETAASNPGAFGLAVAHLAFGYHATASAVLGELQASTTGPVRDSFGSLDTCLSALIDEWPDRHGISANDTVDHLATQVLQLEMALQNTETEKRRLKREVSAMLNSKSWRITKPVRLVLKRLHR